MNSGFRSFDVFYRREHNRLVALAVALCGSTTVAEDVVQDAFVAAFGQWERIDHPDASSGPCYRNQVFGADLSRGSGSGILLVHNQFHSLWAKADQKMFQNCLYVRSLR